MILESIVVVTAVLVVATAIYNAVPVRTVLPAPCRSDVPAHLPEPNLHVSVLGQVTALRRGEALRLSDRQLEALAFLAIHPAGVTESEIRTALWGDRPSTSGALRNLLWQLRRQVGPAKDGQPLVAFADEHGRYRLHGDVTCDLLRLAEVMESGELPVLLSAIKGRPFECRRGFEWAHSEGLVAWAEGRIVALTEEVGGAMISDGDGAEAAALAEAAIVAVPEDERLHRVLLRAGGLLGDRGGVERSMDRLLAAAGDPDDAASWLAIDPQTIDAYVEAGGRRRPATSFPSGP